MNITEAAERLNVPRNWLADKVTERAVPHTRIGKHVRFTPEHLAQIIAEGEQTILSKQSSGPRGTKTKGTARSRL